MYKFKYVYKRISKKGEELEYKIINKDIELVKELVESLQRSSMATIKYKDDYMELYYNM